MSEQKQPTATAFISHTEADWGFVSPFAATLRQELHVEARVYKWEKKAGRERYLEEAVKADVFVPVLSVASVCAPGVLAEINVVTDKIVNNPDRVIPVILGDLPKDRFPGTLRGLVYVRGNLPDEAAAEVARLIHGEEHPEKPPLGSGISDTQVARVALPAFKLGVLRGMAEAQDAAAQTALGVMYIKGESVPKDHAEAVKWFRCAAEQGHAEAQFNLGVAYHFGKSVPQDYAEAAKWFRCAAEQGYTEAQFNLGQMYRKGEGVPQDYAESAKWYHHAAEQGYAEAQFNLGAAYANGEGVPQDNTEAVKWFRHAAEQKLAQAQSNLGWAYDNGKGVPKDHTKAAKWYRRAAEQGLAQAQFNFGLMYNNGDGVPKDDAEAKKWLRCAAEQGFAKAEEILREMGESIGEE